MNYSTKYWNRNASSICDRNRKNETKHNQMFLPHDFTKTSLFLVLDW